MESREWWLENRVDFIWCGLHAFGKLYAQPFDQPCGGHYGRNTVVHKAGMNFKTVDLGGKADSAFVSGNNLHHGWLADDHGPCLW